MSRKKQKFGALNALILIITFLVSSLTVSSLVGSADAASGFTLKWVANLGLGTYIGPIAAHVIPGTKEMQIAVSGVVRIDQSLSNGSVALLNGSSGALIWKKNPDNILDHSPLEIADLNKDGTLEIIVANMGNTLVLCGNNGSTFWKNSAAPSYFNYPVVGDVNGDAYPEVFVCSGLGPYVGVDYITELSSDGLILAQTPDWHPCWGGLALGDPNYDGRFIIVQGDRSSTSGSSSDPYKGGGWGVRALDARTLTPLWNDSSFLCSSHIPMFADVNGDGVLDVVVAMQSSGLAVYNAFNGTVLSTGGLYRKNSNLGLNSHSQPTIYYDTNGHPQLITCHDSNPKIWDLRSWKLTKTLNVVCNEPPKMGRVTADQQMNIIAIDSSDIVHIYNQDFVEVDNITGLSSPNQFTLVQDVDGDGYNELVLSSRSGSVYCYDTPALAVAPAPKSNIAFYSPYRLGVAEYVETPGPKAPQIILPSPVNGATNISVTQSTLSFNLTDYQSDLMNYTVSSSPNVGAGSGTNVPNGRYTATVAGLQFSTTYSWTVNATDGKKSNMTTYTFTTAGAPPNTAPQITLPSPTNESTGIPTSQSSLSFSLSDNQGDLMNYTVSTSPNVGAGSGTNVPNGNYSISVSGLNYLTMYSWTVNASDGKLSSSATFTFTTIPTPPLNTAPVISSPLPANGTTDVPLTLSTLSFTLTDNENDPLNYTVSTSPNVGVGSDTNVPNGTYNVNITGLQYSTTYNWTVNATDGKLFTLSTYTFTTVQPPPQQQWWDTAWSYRMNVTIDHTKITADLNNFPVLIELTSPNLAGHAQATGNDIVFVGLSDNKLNHEIELYDSASGHLIAWVMVPNLSSSQDTILSMYYGNQLATNQQNPTGVWDSSYLMIQHLKEASGTEYDSTSKHNDGTPMGTVNQAATGKIGNCNNFAGGYIALPRVCSTQTRFTFSAWVYAQSGARYFVSEWANNQGAFLQVAGDSQVQFYVNGVMVAKPVTLNEWHYVVGTYDGTTARLWIDDGSPSSVSAVGLAWPASQDTYVGDRSDHQRQFYGSIDEVRISSIARSSDWVNTEYNNQKNPAAFLTLGQEEAQTTHAPIVSNPSPTYGANGVVLNPTLSVTVFDSHGDLMNIDFLTNSTGSWQIIGSLSNIGNGVYTQGTSSMNSYGTTYWWSVQVADGLYWTNKTYQFTTKSPPPGDWWNSSWQYRMNITIDHTEVSSDQINFPVLVDLTSPTLSAKTQTSGQDFVFTDITDQKLDHQIDSYNSSTGHLTAWVRVPLLSSTTDTTILLYYGNPTCADQQNKTVVWDSSYLMVQHMSDGSTQCNDSTVNGNNGNTTGNVNTAPGMISNSLNFSGGYVQLPRVCSTQTRFTFSAWVYAQSGARYFVSEWANNQGAFLQVAGDSQVQFYVNGVMVAKPVTLNEWHYVVGTYDGTTARLWIDGGTPANTSTTSLTWPTQNMYIGDRSDHQRQFVGLIDEVRVSNVARSNDWINIEYNNQNNPSAFYTIGPEETFSN